MHAVGVEEVSHFKPVKPVMHVQVKPMVLVVEAAQVPPFKHTDTMAEHGFTGPTVVQVGPENPAVQTHVGRSAVANARILGRLQPT